jgi:hypothetical protein
VSIQKGRKLGENNKERKQRKEGQKGKKRKEGGKTVANEVWKQEIMNRQKKRGRKAE